MRQCLTRKNKKTNKRFKQTLYAIVEVIFNPNVMVIYQRVISRQTKLMSNGRLKTAFNFTPLNSL